MNKSVKLNTALSRAVPLVVALLCVFAVYFAVKWYLANSLATTTPYIDVAEYATELAPSDARTHYTLAVMLERNFDAADLPKSLAEYEKAAALSPNDFRLWAELGEARGRSGDLPGAEKALRKAVALAPNYSNLHWTLGNILLREGDTEESFSEIRKAVENDPKYANPAVNIVWQYFNGETRVIAQKIGDSPQIKLALAVFLAKQKRLDEALSLWNALSEGDRTNAAKDGGQAILQALIEAKRFRDALAVEAQINPAAAGKSVVGKFTNGGFEANVETTTAGTFDWKIDDAQQPQIGFDDQQKHDGNRSLVIVFNSPTGKEFRTVQQTIAVEGGRHYTFETFARSALKARETVYWQILDAADNKVLASTAVVPENSEWQPLAADFTTQPTTQAVIVRLARVSCPTMVCSIVGRVWFDDFNLR